jgi:hypothetical protein
MMIARRKKNQRMRIIAMAAAGLGLIWLTREVLRLEVPALVRYVKMSRM